MVKGKIIDQILGDKIRVATYKAKSRYRKVKGHRDQLTRVLIEKIEVKD
ncbi:MAG: bL21 family ribosomal protein [Patescibacteria group bacterium]|nr:bL21 family ribosomal protein [Patescibacteria group bacterium]